MRRYELSDLQWARLEPFLPHRTHHGKAGHPFNDHRPIVNGILWILHTGAPWRDLPERYGPWETVYYRFNRWRQDGTWARIVTALLDELDDLGKIDHDCGASMAPSSAPAVPPPGQRGGPPASDWAGGRKPNCRSHLTMPWGVRGADSGRRSTWSVTAMGSFWRSTSRRGSPTRARPSSRPWPGGCSTAARHATLASVAGRGQGLQLPEDPAVVPAAADQAGDPDAEGSAPGGGLRQGEI